MKIGCFPVVDHDGAGLVYPVGIDQIRPDCVMQLPAHTADAVEGVGEHHLGRLKILAGLELPAEIEVVDAAVTSVLPSLVDSALRA